MRVSFGLAAVYSADESVELIRAADAAGLHGCYLGDDLSLHDPWVLCGAAARETRSIRLGFSVTHAYLRTPTLIAQALATLDQLSDGRIEAGVGLGGPQLLDAHHVDWRDRPMARLREALEVIRRLLQEGRLDHEGEFFRYTDVELGVRPVQPHVPLLVGAMVGPRSFQLAGEVGDGVHAGGCSRAYATYVVEQVAEGARRASRDPRELDVATYAITAVAEDAEAARFAARAMVAGWMPAFPRRLIVRHGFDESVIDPIVAAMSSGDQDEAMRRIPDELVDALAVAGTPEECVEKIRRDLVEPGIGHVIMGIADPGLVAAVAGSDVNVPDVRGQLSLIGDRVIPALAGVSSAK
ncbi:MAG TPA: LLM class flavin-dependent oxidoreductase [Euzebyales bacterium]|nr:LLM class flavin-dependent oxidoreductase [Euzebyales bacterium]